MGVVAQHRLVFVVAGMPAAGLAHADYLRDVGCALTIVKTPCEISPGPPGSEIIVASVTAANDPLADRFSRSDVIVLFDAGFQDAALDALDAGAADCFPTHGSPRELLARVRAIFRARARRSAGRPDAFYLRHDLVVDTYSLTLRSRDGGVVKLSEAEFALLRAFMDQPNTVLSRNTLIDLTMGPDVEVYDRAIDTMICRLRRKLLTVFPQDPISTYRREGYRLRAGAIGRI